MFSVPDKAMLYYIGLDIFYIIILHIIIVTQRLSLVLRKRNINWQWQEERVFTFFGVSACYYHKGKKLVDKQKLFYSVYFTFYSVFFAALRCVSECALIPE